LLLKLEWKLSFDDLLKFLVNIVQKELIFEKRWNRHPANWACSRVRQMLANALNTKSMPAWKQA
jgi:hypothetical protein